MHWPSLRGTVDSSATQCTDGNLNSFSLSLFAAAAAKNPDVALSPVSVAAVTGLALAGATDGSAAQSELHNALNADPIGVADALRNLDDNKQDIGVKMTLATSAWVMDGVREEYRNFAATEFAAEVESLGSPSAVDEINSWVAIKTNGMISRIIDVIEGNTVALLVSAVYFKAVWMHAFDKSETAEGVFRSASGNIPVEMMHREGSRWAYAEIGLSPNAGRDWRSGGVLKLLEMPYGDKGRYSAIVGLPAHGATVDDAIAGIAEWDSWMKEIAHARVQITKLAIPKFRIEYGVETMKPSLKAMGVKAAWQPPMQAPGKSPKRHFEKMTSDPLVYLSDVLHKVVIECSEEGTKAAAASVAVMMTRSVRPSNEVEMIVDRPFLFAIRDTVTRSILFLARIDNPKNL